MAYCRMVTMIQAPKKKVGIRAQPPPEIKIIQSFKNSSGVKIFSKAMVRLPIKFATKFLTYRPVKFGID